MGSMAGDPEGYDVAKPRHEVQVSLFAIGKYEVTQAQRQAVTHDNPSKFFGCDDCRWSR